MTDTAHNQTSTDLIIAAAVERIQRVIDEAKARRDAERTTAATMQKIAEGGR